MEGVSRLEKLDFKKAYKELYLPKPKPAVITVPQMNFVMIDGTGDPNKAEFSDVVSALYSFSYTLRMSYKNNCAPEGFYEYTVFPLEGMWDLMDKAVSASDKSNFEYTIMIRQPEFLTADLFEYFLNEVKKKKANPYLDKLRYGTITEGLCCQMLHVGSYDSETESFAAMDKFCADNGYIRISRRHREIYMSDPRKCKPDNLKTVLRYQVQADTEPQP